MLLDRDSPDPVEGQVADRRRDIDLPDGEVGLDCLGLQSFPAEVDPDVEPLVERGHLGGRPLHDDLIALAALRDKPVLRGGGDWDRMARLL